MREKKEKRKKDRNKGRRKRTESKFSLLVFLNSEKDYWNSGGRFYFRIAKGFHL